MDILLITLGNDFLNGFRIVKNFLEREPDFLWEAEYT
jgi:hypothetical protein